LRIFICICICSAVMFLKPAALVFHWIGLVESILEPDNVFGPHPPCRWGRCRHFVSTHRRKFSGLKWERGWRLWRWRYSGCGRSGQRVGKVNHPVPIPRVQVVHHLDHFSVWKEAVNGEVHSPLVCRYWCAAFRHVAVLILGFQGSWGKNSLQVCFLIGIGHSIELYLEFPDEMRWLVT
jgi:hypothetical protein